jgi:hypothetical protein
MFGGGVWAGLIATMVVMALGLSGCASSTEQSQEPKVTITRTATQRLDVVAGSTLVLPLDGPLASIRPSSTIAADDGTPLRFSLHRVSVTVAAPGPGDLVPDQWLPAPGWWVSTPAASGERTPAGSVVLVVPMPEAVAGQGLRIDGRRFAVNWLPAADRLVRSHAGAEVDPWRAILPADDKARATLLPLAQSESESPLTRWRAQLLVNGLRPDEPEISPFEDPVIEALARQNEDRWRVAICWLWAADQFTSWQLKQRLCAWAQFPDRAVPVWSTDHASLDALLEQLLDPSLKPDQRVERARAWLDEQPRMVAWVEDDGGVLDANRHVVAVGAVANISDRATMVWGTRADVEIDPDLLPIVPWSVQTVGVPLGSVQNEQGELSLARFITLHGGSEARTLAVLPGRVPVTPPGFAIETLLRDWTLPEWLAGRAKPPRPEWATRALLYATMPAEGMTSRRWELLVQCNRRQTIGSESHEVVRVFLGPSDAPRAILRVTPTGEMVDELITGELAKVETIEVLKTPERWSFRVALPSSAVEKDGTLRLGISRVDAAGRRSSWPRQSFPWSMRPSRGALDVSAWER